MKNENFQTARKFGNVFRYIDDLLAINDGGEFESNYLDIYPAELELKKENQRDNEATFLDLHLQIINKQIMPKLNDKRDGHNFQIVRFPYKCSNLPTKMFHSSISAELLRINRVTSDFNSFFESANSFLARMRRQDAKNEGIKNTVNKMLFCYKNEFGKFNLSMERLSNMLLE